MKNKHIVGNRATERPHLLREEVSGPDGLDVPLNEVVPSAAVTFRPGIETVLLEDAVDRCSGDIIDTELLEFPEDASIAPTGGLGHIDNELADLFRLPRPTPLAGLHAGLVFAEPSGESPGVDDGDDVLDLRSKPHAEFQQLGPFCRSHLDPFGELIPSIRFSALRYSMILGEFLSVARAKSIRRGWMNRFM